MGLVPEEEFAARWSGRHIFRAGDGIRRDDRDSLGRGADAMEGQSVRAPLGRESGGSPVAEGVGDQLVDVVDLLTRFVGIKRGQSELEGLVLAGQTGERRGAGLLLQVLPFLDTSCYPFAVGLALGLVGGQEVVADPKLP